jgi:hypothetical protein
MSRKNAGIFSIMNYELRTKAARGMALYRAIRAVLQVGEGICA